MPIYKNISTVRKEIAGVILEPGEEKPFEVWLSPLPADILKVSDAPYSNPIVLSEKYTSNTTVAVPEGVTRFQIHIYVAKGSPAINFSSSSNTPALKLYPTAKWNIRCFERVINDIRLSNMTDAEVWIIIEKI